MRLKMNFERFSYNNLIINSFFLVYNCNLLPGYGDGKKIISGSHPDSYCT